MARLTDQEIERLKAQGAQKRAERALKRAAREEEQRQTQATKPQFDPVFEAKVIEAGLYLERVYYKRESLTEEKVKEVKELFLPDASEAEKIKAYQAHFHAYEILIFFAWAASSELCDAAFEFWNAALKDEKSSFSGNSIIRILGCRPNENLLKIFKNHQQKFTAEPFMKLVMHSSITRALKDGYFDSNTFRNLPFTAEEITIWREIAKLFE
ncbi:MAG: hypothetical protein IJ830_00580 [Alphaproteobacteria bacterium]|nr:hypothetical protein [Alphaproteobacteria bacterium]